MKMVEIIIAGDEVVEKNMFLKQAMNIAKACGRKIAACNDPKKAAILSGICSLVLEAYEADDVESMRKGFQLARNFGI